MHGNRLRALYTDMPFAIYKELPTDGERHISPYQRREMQLLTVTAGRVELTLASTVYSMYDGDLILIPPNTAYTVRLLPHSAYGCIALSTSLVLDGELRHAIETGNVNTGGVIHSANDGARDINAHLLAAVTVCGEKKRGWQMSALGHISLAVSLLVGGGSLTVSPSDTADNGFCAAVLAYIAEHYSEPITSTTAAAALYLNNSYFCRLFRKHFNSNFSDFLNAYRIDRARQILRDTSMSVADVAAATGFNSFSYFCKLFRATTGMSPTDFRRGA